MSPVASSCERPPNQDKAASLLPFIVDHTFKNGLAFGDMPIKKTNTATVV